MALADAISRPDGRDRGRPCRRRFEVRLIRDDSEFIRASLAAIEEHLILGGVLAAVIVLVFLRNFRSTLIAAVAIPASIIGAFGVMAALDFTLNQMTMLALTLMVGIVIDDAIVVLENIYRFVEEKGMTPMRAAVEGTKEIGLAVMATTLSLLAVFLPVGFLGGIIGRFMSSFGLTSAAAIAISLIVSFTLTPMLASRWIKHDHDDAPRADASRRGFYRHIDRIYTRMLEFSMAHRWVIVGVCAMVIASMVPLFRASGINFTPAEDESRFQIQVRLPVGSSLAATHVADGSDRPRHARADCRASPTRCRSPAAAAAGSAQTNAGSLFVRLKPIDEREFSQQELIARARRMVQPYRQSAVISIQAAGGLVALSGRGAQSSTRWSARTCRSSISIRSGRASILSKNEVLVDVDRTYLPGRPELRLNIDRKRAGDLGVRVQDVSQTVNALVAGQKVTTFNAASDQYDVVLRAQDSFRRTPESIAAATVRTGTGELVQLRNLVTLERRLRPRGDRAPQPPAADFGQRQPGARARAGRRPDRCVEDTFAFARHGAGLLRS